jgi:TetR/AcrR family transcriptional repressor of nem operon
MAHFERCLAEARDAGEIPADSAPKAIAEHFLTGFEGALLISKVMKSPVPLRNFVALFFDRVL